MGLSHALAENLPQGKQCANADFSDSWHRLECFAFEKGRTRGGSTAPPGPTWAENRVFPTGRQTVCFEMHRVSN